mgnify:FL=1
MQNALRSLATCCNVYTSSFYYEIKLYYTEFDNTVYFPYLSEIKSIKIAKDAVKKALENLFLEEFEIHITSSIVGTYYSK